LFQVKKTVHAIAERGARHVGRGTAFCIIALDSPRESCRGWATRPVVVVVLADRSSHCGSAKAVEGRPEKTARSPHHESGNILRAPTLSDRPIPPWVLSGPPPRSHKHVVKCAGPRAGRAAWAWVDPGPQHSAFERPRSTQPKHGAAVRGIVDSPQETPGRSRQETYPVCYAVQREHIGTPHSQRGGPIGRPIPHGRDCRASPRHRRNLELRPRKGLVNRVYRDTSSAIQM